MFAVFGDRYMPWERSESLLSILSCLDRVAVSPSCAALYRAYPTTRTGYGAGNGRALEVLHLAVSFKRYNPVSPHTCHTILYRYTLVVIVVCSLDTRAAGAECAVVVSCIGCRVASRVHTSHTHTHTSQRS